MPDDFFFQDQVADKESLNITGDNLGGLNQLLGWH